MDNLIHQFPPGIRKIWSRESGINFTMPSRLSGNSTTPEASRSSASAIDKNQFETTSSTGGKEPQADRETAFSSVGMTGSWPLS